jgi:biopolymer transport protein TolR
MSFRRHRKVKSDINVVPYIDVLLVLLVIFMVTAPLSSPGVVDLPKVSRSNHVVRQPATVTVQQDGSLTLKLPEALSEISVSAGNLKTTLASWRTQNPDVPVLVAGDRLAKYELVVNVMDELNQAGITRVGLLVSTNRSVSPLNVNKEESLGGNNKVAPTGAPFGSHP